MNTKPPPGSPEAIALSCSCPRMDNHHGKGYLGIQDIYVYSGACAFHAEELDAINNQIEAKQTKQNYERKQ